MLLALDGVTKRFGSLTVADGITFAVPEGEALGIIGPNGAGKSTLFDLITGMRRPDAGTVTFAGRDVTALSPRARCLAGIGRSFQIPQPFAKLTVFENLLVAATFGARRSQRDAAAFCAGILERTAMLGKADVVAGTLPLLDRKRLELARAMATAPKLLLLDEIAGGLTDAECAALVETIRALHREGVTIVWIEHVLHALNSVVERLLVLDFGKVIAVGAPAETMASRAVREIYLGIDV